MNEKSAYKFEGQTSGRPRTIDVEQLKQKALAYLEKPEDFYTTIVNFAREAGISKRRLYELKEENADLAHILDRIVDRREDMLERNGLIGEYNSNLAKFALSQIGWTEKQEIKETSNQRIIEVVDETV